MQPEVLTRRSEVAAAISTKVATRLSVREAAAEAARQLVMTKRSSFTMGSSRVREFLDRVAPEAREDASSRRCRGCNRRGEPAIGRPASRWIPSIEQRRTGEPGIAGGSSRSSLEEFLSGQQYPRRG